MVRKLTLKEFINRSIKLHGDKYDYSNVLFNTNRDLINIYCKEHGSFFQRVDSHMRAGYGCKSCSDDSKRDSIIDFIKKGLEIHGNLYDYSKVNYTSYNKNIEIICKEHGVFKQTPHNHLNQQGCPKCKGGISYTVDDFIGKAISKHKDKYDYSKVNYVNSKTDIIIICKSHGDFRQRADNHLNKGYGCPKCRCNSISKIEKTWLDSLCIPSIIKQFKIGRYKVDGYDPITNTVYEFYGDYWHGNKDIYNIDDLNYSNGKKFGDLYLNTFKREDKLKSLGYNLVTIWESDFKKNFKKIKNKI